MMKAKRLLALLSAMIFLLSAGCSNAPAQRAEPVAAAAQTPAPTPSPVPTAQPRVQEVYNPSEHLIAMVMIGGGEDPLLRSAQHAFLQTAGSLGYPALLIAEQTNAAARSRLEEALEQGAEGVLIWADCPAAEQLVTLAREKGAKVVAPYAVPSVEADAVLAPEPQDYMEEAARLMCEEATNRKLETGTILVVPGEGNEELVAAFTQAVSQNYPQFSVVTEPLTEEKNDALAEDATMLEQFIAATPNLAGMLALEPGSPQVVYDSEIKVEKALKAARKSSSDNSYKRVPVIMALDYTDENLRMVESAKIFALIARPYFDSAAQGTAVLDRLLRGIVTQRDVRLNAPIVRKSGIAKYRSIMDDVKEWFELKE